MNKSIIPYQSNDVANTTKTNERLYLIWKALREQCKKNAPTKNQYYDNDISVCFDWFKSYDEFKLWAIENGYDDTKMVYRNDNSVGYSTDNCTIESLSLTTQHSSDSLNRLIIDAYEKRRKEAETIYRLIEIIKVKNSRAETISAYNRFILDNDLTYPLIS